MTAEQEARRQVDGRIHGLKVRLGQARAEVKRAETLAQKVARCGRVKELEEELRSLYRTYWDEVEKLEAEADSSAP